MPILYVLIAVCSYFLGSIPFGFIIAKRLKGIDIQQHGSGNIGATNVMRSIGAGPAAIVFTTDILKGFIPVLAAKSLVTPSPNWFVVTCGILAILGHTLSIFLKFRGGKGVATSLGVIIGLDPRVAAIGFGLWVIILVISRYVSLSSMVAALSIPILMGVFKAPLEYTVFAIVASLYVVVKHRQNISRLIRGNEARFGEKAEI